MEEPSSLSAREIRKLIKAGDFLVIKTCKGNMGHCKVLQLHPRDSIEYFNAHLYALNGERNDEAFTTGDFYLTRYVRHLEPHEVTADKLMGLIVE